jgi:hypothetical protein
LPTYKISEYHLDENTKVTKFVESSIYEGAPLIIPTIPYFYKVEVKKTDQKDKFLKRFKDKSKFIQEDFIEYLKDIAFGRQSAFMFKTSHFC